MPDTIAAVDPGNPVDQENGVELDLDPDEVEASQTTQGEEEEEEETGREGFPDAEYASDTSSQTTGSDSLNWITWFCTLPGHEYFAEVSEDFIEDDFNLTGLNALVPFYKEALDMLLDLEAEEETLKIPDVSIVESSAELLYGLIHQRFIITRQGLQQMADKWEAKHFGICPRVYCNGTKVVPCGRSDLPGVDTVKLFCPNCIDTYAPPSSRFTHVDGAHFGTTFPHLLFQTYRDLVPKTSLLRISATPADAKASESKKESAPSEAMVEPSTVDQLEPAGSSSASSSPDLDPTTPDPAEQANLASRAKVYEPKIYGFNVSERARSGPRMAWLRQKPRAPQDLDKIDFNGKLRPEITTVQADQKQKPNADGGSAANGA